MVDSYNRKITYLRVSVTDLCNLRCRYCMPEDGICKQGHKDMLSEEELVQAVRAAADLGITKVRVTGGEPLVKRNIVDICEKIAKTEGIREVCITTNGILLPKLAKPLKKAGVSRVNISLDTLDAKKYGFITRTGVFKDAEAGIKAALETGFEKVKINCVLIGGFNDDEIEAMCKLTLKYPADVRFIELMPMYDSGDFKENAFISGTEILKAMPALEEVPADGGVARLYRLKGSLGNVGIINPVSAHFCAFCNRIRLTADGKLKPCLHSVEEYSIKGMNYDEMLKQFEKAIYAKPQCHDTLSAVQRSKAGRNMNEIGG